MREKEVYGHDSHDFYTENRARGGSSKGLRMPPTGGRTKKKKRRYLTDDLYPASRVSEQKRVSEVQTNERNV